MLVGCSSTLLSPRYRLSEASAARFQADCHFPLPSPMMSTQRLDLPCSLPPRSVSSSSIRPQPPLLSFPVGEKPTDSGCTLKQTIRVPPSPATAQWEIGGEQHQQLWKEEDEVERGEGLSRKRRLEVDECCIWERVKRNKDSFFLEGSDEGLDLPLHNPWVMGSVVTKNTEFSSKEGEINPGSSGSSSSSSEGHSYGVNDSGATTILEHNNGHRPWNPGYGQVSSNPAAATTNTAVAAHNGGNHEHVEEKRGLELVSLLAGCIDSITARNTAAISYYMARLGEIASPRGGSPVSRLIAYFTEALAVRLTRVLPHAFDLTLPRELERADDDTANDLRLLNQVSPIPKFIHFTANEMLMRAFEGKDKIHIIDFDIKQGLQWPAFFQSLASRENPPSHVRITGIGESKQDLIETGERLHGFAEEFNLPFEFHPVVDTLEGVRLWMLHVKEGESVAVNCIFQLHKLLYDPNGVAFRDFMGVIRSTNPIAVVMAEQEAEHNEMNLERRVCNSLRYYSAIFDAIHLSLPLDSATRVKIEEMFAREIRNMVACEGKDRFERHQSFEKWSRRLMDGAGFRCAGVSKREILQIRMLLKMYDCEEYNVEKQESEGCEGVTLRWLDQPLYTVSAWKPEARDVVAGSCSILSQLN